MLKQTLEIVKSNKSLDLMNDFLKHKDKYAFAIETISRIMCFMVKFTERKP